MNAHHAPRSSTVRSRTAVLAVAGTIFVALVAWFLAAVAHLPEQAVVIPLMVVSFIVSWMVTNARVVDHRHHRVTVVPMPTRVR